MIWEIIRYVVGSTLLLLFTSFFWFIAVEWPRENEARKRVLMKLMGRPQDTSFKQLEKELKGKK